MRCFTPQSHKAGPSTTYRACRLPRQGPNAVFLPPDIVTKPLIYRPGRKAPNVARPLRSTVFRRRSSREADGLPPSPARAGGSSAVQGRRYGGAPGSDPKGFRKRHRRLQSSRRAIIHERTESNGAGRTHITNGPSIPGGPGRPHNWRRSGVHVRPLTRRPRCRASATEPRR